LVGAGFIEHHNWIAMAKATPITATRVQSKSSTKAASADKGARSIASVRTDHLATLEAGLAQSKTLSELLAIDFAKLLFATDRKAAAQSHLDAKAGVTARMLQCAQSLVDQFGAATTERFATHASDTVRGWAAYTLAINRPKSTAELLKRIRPFADDAHFGVREWAWLAVRPQLVEQLDESIRLLSKWSQEKSPYLRRFASEALRPRGVWCSHISALRQQPALALSILEPLRADPERYVQDSVANWLNDASKDQPQWVSELCARWQASDTNAATAYICKRALRTVLK
jgi:3-methyladenine DNA glycosylase AlkC